MYTVVQISLFIYLPITIITILVEFDRLYKDENVNRYAREGEREREFINGFMS